MKRITLLFTFMLVMLISMQAQSITELTKTLPEEDTILNNEYYGYSVAVDGDYSVIGAYGYNNSRGRAIVLYNSGASWDTIAILTASDGEQDDYFGSSVSISGSSIVVGAYGDDDNGAKSGASYVFEKPSSGWTSMTETAKLTASDGAAGDILGFSVSISDTTVVVGAHLDSDKGTSSGSAYVFVKPNGGWSDITETAKLTASDGAEYDYFGGSVSISDSTVVVGADGNDDMGSSTGSAYVFVKPVSGWSDMEETAKLTASDMSIADLFGNSVSISDSTVVVGAKGDDIGRGTAYVFVKPVSGWADMTETAKLTASDQANNDNLGCSVSISDSIVVVGAYKDNSSSGSAYVFVKPVSGWIDMTETAKLTASDGDLDDYFGYSVSISDSSIVVGAYHKDDNGYSSGSAYFFEKPESDWSSTTETFKSLPPVYNNNAIQHFGCSVSVDGDYAVIGAYSYNSYIGRAYVLHKNESGWEQIAVLSASDGASLDYFGYSVSISDGMIVIGAYGDDDNGSYGGSAYVFEEPTSGWTDMTETAKLSASDGVSSDYFGYSVSILESMIVIGAYGDDDNGSSSGSAYVFEEPTSGWTDMTETAKLSASDGASTDYFGYSVSISDSVVVVGARGDNTYTGSVYVFEEPADGWSDMTETAKLTASDGASYDHFGYSVSISDSTIVIGAKYDDDNGSSSGSAYVFEEPTDGWSDMTETAKLTASDGAVDNNFGGSVSISDSIIVIGANRDDDMGSYSGSAYVFLKPETGWSDNTQTFKITASDGATNDYYGNSVYVSGFDVVVGAYKKDDNGSESGAAYFYSVSYPINIESEPVSLSNVCDGTFTVEGSNIESYLWQISTDNGVTYSDLSNSDIYEGVDSSTLVVASDASVNNAYFRCIVANAAFSDTTIGALLELETEAPVITCIGDTEATTALWNGYTVNGTEFDPTETSDNCAVGSITNDFNNASTLADAFLPVGTTTVVWTITDEAGNSATCSCDITISSTSSIDAEATVSYTLFPNPTTGTVNITLGNTENADLKIFSITGEKVYDNVSFAGGTVDLSEMAEGIYFVQLTSNGKTSITKLMKK